MMGSYRLIRLLIAIAIVLLTFVSAQATNTLRPKSSPADREFARATAQISAVEIAESALALTHTKRGDIHDFAQNLLDERTTTDHRLRQVASDDSVAISIRIPKIDRQKIDRLSKLYDGDFERQYVSDEASAIWSQIMRASAESRNGTNPGLQFFATQRLPTLLGDQHMIQEIAAGATVGVPPPPAPLGWHYQPPSLPY
ncbi:MAG: DUF4142 domain-containing protein [Alphaproteobacteria bacterium]|nr:DUF4142 domain-containing protein [Alphaproteobacteria bacterium]